MERQWERATGPGTLDDMVEDARAAGFPIEKRTVHDWIGRGLLDRPVRRGAGRGSRPGLHSENQRRLFLLLLSKREEMPKRPALALIPLNIWLWWGEECVPLRQALKAFSTWCGDGASPKEACHRAARDALNQMDHPGASDTARNRFIRIFTEIAYQGGRLSEAKRDEFEAAARAVFEPPSVFRSTRLIHAAGPPGALITVDGLIARTSGLAEAVQLVRTKRLTEALLDRAGVLHRHSKREYAALRPGLAAQTTGTLSELFAERTMDEEFNSAGRDLLMALGWLLTSPRAQ
ncbi:hypothetical protein [Actinomadura parmotrematis]|uniref:MerR family transcriptional regulator n=1 Tax=Actinomadura parmotrematis TaxID=2864039 RepID=A0ABS7FXG0_9ACTN|nr:hypothetical protein [Actinomadura parmotrematis]MBW8485122.1 hypothetical protein [Actinomadura parmotrematis]